MPTDTTTLRGLLRVEVPHWAAQLKVFDSRGQLVLQPDEVSVQANPARNGAQPIWQATAELAPGVYEVELSLEEQTAHQLAIVRETETCLLTRDSWSRFQLLSKSKSAVPLVGLVSTVEAHRRAAEKWSRELTGTKSTGNSRLFLFIRTLSPKKGVHFFDNISLLDSNEKLVTDFSEGVKINETEGWMAFTADLPAGFYLLKRRRYDQYRTKYQPLYLCGNWETQAFLLTTKRPSLQTLALSMAPLGAGFRSDDDTIRATGILLNSLKRGISPNRLVLADAMNRILNDRTDNPWLSILLAYLIRLQQDQLLAADRPPSALWPSLLASWPALMNRLDAVGAHPDVQALQLDMNAAAPAPILYPPLLYAGLRRVQQHSLQFAETVPVDSLLKRLLPRISTTSAWTAWRQTRQPAHAPVPKQAPMADADAMADPPEVSPAAALNTSAPDYLRLVSPKLPMYQVQAVAPDGHSQAGGPTGNQSVSSVLLTVLALQATQTLTAARLEDMPLTTQLNPADDLASLLNSDHAGVISQASGVPLAQVQSSLTKLQVASQQPTTPEKNLTVYDRTVLGHAIQQAVEGMLDDPLLTTIEECVNKLLTESGRLASQFSGGPLPPDIGRLVGRIHKLVDQLLLAARFVVLTDVDGKIALSNGVFVTLLKETSSPGGVTLDKWESFFKLAPFGSSELPYEYVNKGSAAWNLRRTVLHDDDHNRVVYLNIFQNQDGTVLVPGQLKKLDSLLPRLVLSTSSIAYDQSAALVQLPEKRAGQIEKIETILTQMEQALNG